MVPFDVNIGFDRYPVILIHGVMRNPKVNLNKGEVFNTGVCALDILQRDLDKNLRPAYKPHFVRWSLSSKAPKSLFPMLYLDGHLSVQPTRNSNDASSVSSLFGLAPGGGYLAACITADAGGLLHRLFTMTAFRRLSVSVARSGKLPHPGVSPVPCSVECGLSSTLR
jgi:hypothetical protein